MGGFFGFCYRQLTFKPKPLPSNITVEGRTALITGANSGLGLEAARELVSHGLANLIIAVRDITKGETAKNVLLQVAPKCQIQVWSLDYDSYDSIVEFGNRIATLERLDYVLMNAGIKKTEYSTSHTGHEQNVQINHIGTSAVSLAILPVLQRSAQLLQSPTRMTIVSSEGHFWVPFKEHKSEHILETMDDKKTFGSEMDRYYTSKLLNVLWTRELASKVSPQQVIINTVNPGFCYSGLHRHQGGGIKLFLWALAWTSVQGGHCLTDALVQHPNSHGEYLSEQQQVPPSPFVLSADGQKAQKKTWDETITLLQKEATGLNVLIES